MSYGERLRRKAEEARLAKHAPKPPQTHEDALQEAERKVEEARAREARVAAREQYEPKLRELRKPRRK